MIITLSGPQSVGKTTLLTYMKFQNPEFRIYSNTVRGLVKTQHLKINDEGTGHTQNIIMGAHEYNILEAYVPENRNQINAFDRCALDCYAYTLWSYRHNKINKNIVENIKSRYLTCLKYYDVMFYLKREFEIADDHFRSLDKEFQGEVQSIMDELTKDLPNVFVLTGSTEQRYKQMLEHVNI